MGRPDFGERVAHDGVRRLGILAVLGVAPIVLEVVDAPGGILARILEFVAAAAGPVRAGGVPASE